MMYVSAPLDTNVPTKEVVSLHYFEYVSSFTFSGEIHDFWELVCVDKGEIDMRADGRVVTLRRGSITFHKPNEFHNVLTSGRIAPNLIVIGFACHSPCMEAFRDQVLTIQGRRSNLSAQIIAETRNTLEERMDDPYQKVLVKLPVPVAFGAKQLIRHGLEELTIQLYRRYFDHTVQARPYRQSETQVPSETCQRVIHHMEEHISERLIIHQICRDNLTGRPWLQKLFREYCGRGVTDYFNHMKIDAVKQLARDNQPDLTEAFNGLGYTSVCYSSRQLKVLMDMTPSGYAASIRSLSEKNV